MVLGDKFQMLQDVWGFDSFRGNQELVIDSILSGRDTLALMATGGGKSLCYQLPALLQEGICIVVSPLIALMEDQEKALSSRGIKAVSIHSGKSKSIQDQLFDNCVYGGTKFLFLSPEKLNSKLALARIEKMNVSFFVIDEAHCISQWGHDFRPNYLKVSVIKAYFPNKSILALTATATKNVVDDILKFCCFESDYVIFRSTFFRPNISISVQKTSQKFLKILRSVKAIDGSKVIYARNKRHCKEIKEYLDKHKISADIYHADVPIKKRLEVQTQWIKNKIECIVCTSAFGMGIDKSNVRLVLHFDIPPSLEEYIQEIGRAGRDGKKSYAVMLFNTYDLKELEFHFLNSRPSIKEIKAGYRSLMQFMQIPIGDGLGKNYSFDFTAFLQATKINSIKARALFKVLEKNDYIHLNDGAFMGEKLQIIAGKQVLNSFISDDSDLARITKYLLRRYEGLLYGFVNISAEKIAQNLNIDIKNVKKLIALGVKQNIYKYEEQNSRNLITLLTERLPLSNLSINGKDLKALYDAQQIRYESVIDYLIYEDCRALFLIEYFGEISPVNCGICDNCLGANDEAYSEAEYEEASKIIISYLISKDAKLEALVELWPWNKQSKMKAIIQQLLEREVIKFNNGVFSFSEKNLN